jgi:HKD family nuclease
MNKVLKLKTEFDKLVRKADEICISVAMMTDFGLEVFDSRDEECHFEVLVGYDLPTQPSALQRLLDEKVDTKIYDVKNQFFHPKLYFFRIGEDWTAFLGSGNCTRGGLESNIELSLKIENPDIVQELLDWYETYYKLGTILKQEWLDEYSLFYAERKDKDQEIKIITKQFKKSTGVTKGKIPLKDYDFRNQFFGFEHYDAFTPPKPILDEAGPIAERLEVLNKLEELHDLIYPEIIKKDWDVYPHHQSQHLTSSFRHNQYAANSLDAIWLHYGRSEDELEGYKEAYGENMTSLYHMRLEVLILKSHIWVELRVGKNDGSYPDREYIRKQLKTNPAFVKQYYNLLQKLDPSFSVTIANELIHVRDFKDAEDLKEFTLQDEPRLYYFRIGREYKPDDKAISNDNIVNTIMADFEKLYPLYQLFKHTIKA